MKLPIRSKNQQQKRRVQSSLPYKKSIVNLMKPLTLLDPWMGKQIFFTRFTIYWSNILDNYHIIPTKEEMNEFLNSKSKNRRD